MIHKLSNCIFLSLLCLFLFSSVEEAKSRTTYKIAHTKSGGTNMVLVSVSSSFFRESQNTQQKWFTGFEQCSRSANLAGQVIVVANSSGTFKFYGPKTWHKFMRTIDMDWVNARINKNLTCTF